MTTPTLPADAGRPRPLPLWASIPTILACLAAGGWMVHWYVGTHPRADEPHVLGDVPVRPVATAPPRGGQRGTGFAGFFGGGNRAVRLLRSQPGRDTFQATTDRAQATFNVPAGKPVGLGVLSFGTGDAAYGFLAPDVRATIWATRRLVNGPNYIDALKLSPAQVNQLTQRSRLIMAATPADRATLTADFAAYHAAAATAQPPLRNKLLADMDAVAERSKITTRQAMSDAAAQINAIVTPAAWARVKAMGG